MSTDELAVTTSVNLLLATLLAALLTCSPVNAAQIGVDCASAMSDAERSFWKIYVQPSVGAIGAVAVALITGVVGFVRLRKELRAGAHKQLVNTLLGDTKYRSEVEGFLTHLKNEDYEALSMALDQDAVFFYFGLLNAEGERELRAVVNERVKADREGKPTPQVKDAYLIRQYLKKALTA